MTGTYRLRSANGSPPADRRKVLSAASQQIASGSDHSRQISEARERLVAADSSSPSLVGGAVQASSKMVMCTSGLSSGSQSG
jgi:hypothetical protein